MTELKPCPFCGRKPTVTFLENCKKHWICCENEKCKIQPCTDWHTNKSVITREWNRRADNDR